MAISGVYGWYSRTSDKWYVGSSKDIWSRCKTHEKDLIRSKHNGPKFLRAWQKYGAEAWYCFVLEKCSPIREELLAKEQFWINKLDSYVNGYNTLAVAGSPLNVKWTKERHDRAAANHEKLSKLFSAIHKKRWSEASNEQREEHRRAVKLGKQKITKERKDLLSKEAKTRWLAKSEEEKWEHADKVRTRFATMSDQQRSEYSKKGKTPEVRNRQYQFKQCPYCNGEFRPMNFGRFHGDKCRQK